MGYCLYGHEIDENRNPIEAGLDWVLDKKLNFIGSNEIFKANNNKKLIYFKIKDRGIPRQGLKLYSNKTVDLPSHKCLFGANYYYDSTSFFDGMMDQIKVTQIAKYKNIVTSLPCVAPTNHNKHIKFNSSHNLRTVIDSITSNYHSITIEIPDGTYTLEPKYNEYGI